MNAKKKTVLFVTRDKKPGMIATRIARILPAQGVEVRVVAEGLSVAEWKGAGFDNRIVAEGPLDIKAPWDISPKDIFHNVSPDAVVCGLSSPIRSEAWFAAGAKNTDCSGGVPFAVIDDNWGATYRCLTPADLVLTIDELGKWLVSENPAYAHHDHQVEIIGDLSATAAQETIPQSTIDAFNAAKGDAEYVFILASQKWPESDDIVEIGLASCALSLKAGARIVVIPRFHLGAKSEDRERWNQKVVQFGDEFPDVVKILGDSSISTDHLAALADGVFAATGSALRAAAYAGRIPFCVWTPRLAEKLKAESGMRSHPLVAVSRSDENEDRNRNATAIELIGPTNIVSRIQQSGDDIRTAQKRLAPVSFDAVKVANTILAIAK